MTILTWLLSNPLVSMAIAGFLAFVAGSMKGRIDGAKLERNAQKAKEADAYEQHLKQIADAAHARDSVTDRMPDRDPYRRD